MMAPKELSMKTICMTLAVTLITSTTSLALAQGGAHSHHHGSGHKAQQAWGIAGDAKKVSRSVAVSMDDTMRFTPDRLDVKQGETIRFVITNKGKLPHEMVIGSKKELDEHAAMMARSPGMAHEEPSMAHVAPGKSGDIVWTFNRAGSFNFACLIAGHYQAGMRGSISVAAR